MKRRCLHTILCLLLALMLLPMQAFAEPALPAGGVALPERPSYTVELLEERPAVYSLGDDTEYLTEEAAVQYIRQQMVQVNETIVFSMQYPRDRYGSEFFGDAFWADFWRMWERVFAHTGVAHEGDYIKRSMYSGAHVKVSVYGDSKYYYTTFQVDVDYRTTAQQEKAVTQKVDALLAQWQLAGKSDYQKLCTIYDYVTENVEYDYSSGNDKLKYTAYGALMKNSAVCQGYAALIYRLAMECGIDCRVITGYGNNDSHAWNIARLDGKYYNLDATWDASRRQAGVAYEYYLRNEAGFADHSRDEEFDTAAFHGTYPMSGTDYDPDAVPAEKPGDTTGDGKVNNKDAILLMQYLAGWDVVIVPETVDINGDGKVNNKDAIRLLQYISGWDVEIY